MDVHNAAVNASGYCGLYDSPLRGYHDFDRLVGLVSDDLEQRAVVVETGRSMPIPTMFPESSVCRPPTVTYSTPPGFKCCEPRLPGRSRDDTSVPGLRTAVRSLF